MKNHAILIVILLLFSCNKKQEQRTQDTNEIAINNELPSKGDISKVKYIEILPDSKVKNTLESWQAYNTINKSIEDLKNANFDFFTGDFNAFELAVKDIETTIPKQVSTTAIKARILALKTKLFRFQDVINLNTTTKQENLKAIKDVFQAFSDFNLQMNKKFEKEAQNIEKYIEQ